MATRYRLPEALGGAEVVDVERDPALQLWGHPAHLLRTDDGIEMVLQRRHLTEVTPPLPAEPPFESVVHARLANEDVPWTFERSDPAPNGNDWYTSGSDNAYSWADLCAIEPPIRLVPDPFADPVELPWSLSTDMGGAVEIATLSAMDLDRRPNRLVQLAIDTPCDLVPTEARSVARALWAAADVAERQRS